MTADTDINELPVMVASKERIADDIYMFELRPPDGVELPPFTPGSHITVTTPTGQKRRYSLCNDSSERDRYVIAVKQEKFGRGGSLSFTTDIQTGDRISVMPPANDFAMSPSQPSGLIFIAGGIGITPIRSMILHCIRQGQTNFRLYYFTRTPELMAFRSEFESADFAGKIILHHDNGDPDEAYDLWPVLEEPKGMHLYCCGPRGLMDAVRDMTGHWSDSAVHFEDFVGATTTRADDTAFEVTLAKTGETFTVEPGVSILDTLRRHGRHLPSSCESGTCGTCRTRFTDGEPDHRDLVLSESEKKKEIMICVSRANSPSLTLDI